MATKIIDTFITIFKSDSKDMEKGLDNINKKANTTKRVLQGLAVLGVGYFLKRTVQDLLNTGFALNNLSNSLGENIEEIQAWDRAVERLGGSSNAFNETLKNIQQQLTLIPVEGMSPLLLQLNRLGINFRNVDGTVKSSLQVFRELAGVFGNLSQTQSFSLGKRIGLDEGTIRLLQKGSQSAEELIRKQKELGVISKEEAERITDVKNQLQDLGQVLRIGVLQLGSFFLPVVDKAVKGFQKLSGWVKDNKRAIQSFAITAAGIYAGFKAFTLALSLNPFIIALGLVGSAIAILIDDFLAFKEGANSLIDWDALIENAKYLGSIFEEVGSTILSFFENVYEIGFKLGEMIAGLVEKLENLYNKAQKLLGREPVTNSRFSDQQNQTNALYDAGFIKGLNGIIIPVVPRNSSTGSISTQNDNSTQISIQEMNVQTDSIDTSSLSGIVGQGLSNQRLVNLAV